VSTIVDFLKGLSSHGIYDAKMLVDQLPQFGWQFDPDTGTLTDGVTKVRLMVWSPQQMRVSIANDPRSGMIGSDVPEDARLVDGVEIARAAFQVVCPGEYVPGDIYGERGKGFRANVDAIERKLRGEVTQ
jgi:hypothetical protein